MRWEDQRKLMVNEQIIDRNIDDLIIVEAFLKVPREVFVAEEMKHLAYEDAPLAIGHNQTISQPFTVAYMMKALQLSSNDVVLEIGTGSGYQTALLAESVKKVYTIERISALSNKAKPILDALGYSNVEYYVGDGTLGWYDNSVMFDKIIVTAGAPKIPDALLNQLKNGGRMVIPVGEHSLQLYSLATPNGQKVTILLEELLALGFDEAEYDAYLIDISEGEQFGSGFVALNPNSKIPALLDRSTKEATRVFESGAILLYLAEKFGSFLPTSPAERTECLCWLFWQMGSAPYLGGGFGHFYKYAPEKIEYCIDRFAMETKRQLDVLDRQLAENQFMCGDDYTIADMAIWPWYGALVLDRVYDAAEFLDTKSFEHVNRWALEIDERDAVARGRMVNRSWGPPEQQLRERHAASDFGTRTQDKLDSA